MPPPREILPSCRRARRSPCSLRHSEIRHAQPRLRRAGRRDDARSASPLFRRCHARHHFAVPASRHAVAISQTYAIFCSRASRIPHGAYFYGVPHASARHHGSRLAQPRRHAHISSAPSIYRTMPLITFPLSIISPDCFIAAEAYFSRARCRRLEAT